MPAFMEWILTAETMAPEFRTAAVVCNCQHQNPVGKDLIDQRVLESSHIDPPNSSADPLADSWVRSDEIFSRTHSIVEAFTPSRPITIDVLRGFRMISFSLGMQIDAQHATSLLPACGLPQQESASRGRLPPRQAAVPQPRSTPSRSRAPHRCAGCREDLPQGGSAPRSEGPSPVRESLRSSGSWPQSTSALPRLHRLAKLLRLEVRDQRIDQHV